MAQQLSDLNLDLDSYDFGAMAMEAESGNSIESHRVKMTEMVKFFSSNKDNRWKVEEVFKSLRHNLNLSSLKEKDIFLMDTREFIPSSIPQEYFSYPFGMFRLNKTSYFANRLVYPVRDVQGNVMGLCGWDPVDLPKYLDSKNYGYNAKKNCMYGMEELPAYYTSKEPVFITEGIVCTNFLRSESLQALALLGSTLSPYVCEIIKRFGDRAVFLMDNDGAGLSVYKTAKYRVPKSQCYVSLVAKDMDDTRIAEGGIYKEPLLKELREISNPFAKREILSKVK